MAKGGWGLLLKGDLLTDYNHVWISEAGRPFPCNGTGNPPQDPHQWRIHATVFPPQLITCHNHWQGYMTALSVSSIVIPSHIQYRISYNSRIPIKTQVYPFSIPCTLHSRGLYLSIKPDYLYVCISPHIPWLKSEKYFLKQNSIYRERLWLSSTGFWWLLLLFFQLMDL